jgi:hypothetical protein
MVQPAVSSMLFNCSATMIELKSSARYSISTDPTGEPFRLERNFPESIIRGPDCHRKSSTPL